MELFLNGEPVPGDVSREAIETAIRSLAGDDDAFVILAVEDQIYIQTMGDPKGGFILEYRDGSAEQHYVCANTELTTDQVVRAFDSYFLGDDRWKRDLEWLSQSFDYRRPVGRVATLLAGVASLAIGLPFLLLAGWGGFRTFDDAPSMSTMVVILLLALFGLFLTAIGARLAFNRPRDDGTLIGPAILGSVGVVFAIFGLSLVLGEPCTACSGSLSDRLPPALLLLLLAIFCFISVWRRRNTPTNIDT